MWPPRVYLGVYIIKTMEKYSPEDLKKIANNLRQDIIRMLAKAGSGHPGGSLGMADIFTVLYWQILNNNSQKPNWLEQI